MRTVLPILAILFLTSNFNIHGQEKKINFSSKNTKGIKQNKRKLLVLWNEVVFKHESSVMKCDSAIYERSNNSFIAYKNVEINENDSLKIYGDSIHYFGDIQIAYIYGNVSVESNKIKLNTPTLIYDKKTKIAFYKNGATVRDLDKGYKIESQKGTFKTKIQSIFFKENVVLTHKDYQIISDTLIYHTNNQRSDIIGNTEIITNNSTIYSNKGWFDSQNNNAAFKGEVILKSKNQKLFADSVFYNEISGDSYAEGNVLIEDDSAKIIIKGNYGTYNDKTDSIKVWDNSIFIQQDSSDTINIYADQFIRYQDSLKELIICYNNVVINGNLICGDCDSIYYNKTDSTLKCIKDPIIWLDKNQVTGEKIEFKISEGKIYNMSVTNNSMIITRKDSIHYDQIKGDQINGYFKNNALNILDVKKNGKAIYYTNDEKDSLINEINIISCESMKIHIKENKIEKIKFNSKPSGKTLPLEEEKKDFYLDDFKIISKRSYQEKKGVAKGDSPKGR